MLIFVLVKNFRLDSEREKTSWFVYTKIAMVCRVWKNGFTQSEGMKIREKYAKLCKYPHEICQINLHRWDFDNKINPTHWENLLRWRVSRINKSILTSFWTQNKKLKRINRCTEPFEHCVQKPSMFLWKKNIFSTRKLFRNIF